MLLIGLSHLDWLCPSSRSMHDQLPDPHRDRGTPGAREDLHLKEVDPLPQLDRCSHQRYLQVAHGNHAHCRHAHCRHAHNQSKYFSVFPYSENKHV